MKELIKLLSVGGQVVAGTALLTLLGCSREAGSSAARQRETAAAAAAASETAPVGAAQAPSAAASAEPPSGLTRVTAEELRVAIRNSGFKGTLVNAWASWCGPCRREVPMLQALSGNLKPQGVQIVLVSVDDPKDEPKALSFLKDNGITLKSYLVDGGLDEFKTGINPRWPGMLPASFLFDRSAALVHFWGGEAFEEEIFPVTEAFLAGRPVAPETRYGLAPGKVEP